MKCLMQAWDEIEPTLYRWLLKQTQSQHETEDIMQEVFLKAMSNSSNFCVLKDGKSWLFKMTKNLFIDHLRSRVELVDIDELQAQDDALPVITQLQTCLPRILPKLSINDRDIIEHCDLNGVPQTLYAKEQGLSLPATKARLRRARLDLKQKLITECQVKQSTATENAATVCCFKRVQ